MSEQIKIFKQSFSFTGFISKTVVFLLLLAIVFAVGFWFGYKGAGNSTADLRAEIAKYRSIAAAAQADQRKASEELARVQSNYIAIAGYNRKLAELNKQLADRIATIQGGIGSSSLSITELANRIADSQRLAEESRRILGQIDATIR